MIFDETTYIALKAFVETSLQQVEGVPDTELMVEVSPSNMGEQWTGVRMSKLPTATEKRRFVSGLSEVEYAFQLISSQSFSEDEDINIGYSTYLNKVTNSVVSRFREGERPELQGRAKLVKVDVLQQQSQLGTDGKTAIAYVQDIIFTVEIRRY